jgi:hypothetical protein
MLSQVSTGIPKRRRRILKSFYLHTLFVAKFGYIVVDKWQVVLQPKLLKKNKDTRAHASIVIY